MREKELRLALVCFGGVSLAVYMHGVTKEVLKLARASAALHKIRDRDARHGISYGDLGLNGDDDIDTENVYYDLLRDMSDVFDLRVVVDCVAGASAGGINGIFLSRALAHDLAYDPLRDLWLREADVSRLAPPPEETNIWSKIIVDPLVKFVSRRVFGARGYSTGVSDKIPPLVRLRHMKPLFDGVHLVRLLYDALIDMGTPKGPEYSLMPAGHRLETFVTVTDFHGFLRYLPLHDPPVIAEREHRCTFEFSFTHWRNGDWQSDFQNDDVPSLAFAARATACFPGAYAPAQIGEVDEMLGERGLSWRSKDRFFVSNFANYLRAGVDPHKAAFIDGSILNNKPFAAAVKSIHGRPAFREVDRRIVYVDPHPDELIATSPSDEGVPNLWRTLKAAMMDIPRNEPVHDDLAEIQSLNERIRTVKSVITAIKPRVSRHVAEIVDPYIQSAKSTVTAATVSEWRVAANARAARDAGYSYEGYTRLKLQTSVRYLAGIVSDICGFAWDGPAHQRATEILHHWVMRDPIDGERMALPDFAFQDPATLPNWIRFLTTFDLDYQRRRIRYMVSELNQLYARDNLVRNGNGATSHDQQDRVSIDEIDSLKVRLYDVLTAMRRCETGVFVSADLRSAFHVAFRALDDENPTASFDAAVYSTARHDEIDAALLGLGTEMGLNQLKTDSDAILADIHGNGWPAPLVRELLVSYLGFGFWDVISFSVSGSTELGEFNEIMIDRISPNDAKVLIEGDARTLLKGVAMRHFGAFFSRKDRENDYLMGRLNAAERLIDIIMDNGRGDIGGLPEDRAARSLAAKKRAFAAILNVESNYLRASAGLVERLKAKLAEL
ncbi:patatin-like protein [Govanella unica]|uniref:Patatin-like protein n=1 Tax=Govanella unica TaxID=2975056 RepID=A0A9X3TV82_9PROT|nr:patatin-like protein [Govania unica]MDA5192400.1 patatin-like protein [Govania unica]